MRTTARIGEIDINYTTFGAGRPVLLIMGFGARGDSWTPLSEALAGAGYMAIQFDNRDVGWSSLVESPPYELADMAADAVGLLDHLGIERASLVGISMGGMIAQEILARFPERIDRAVLMATTPGGPDAVMPTPEILGLLMARATDPVGMLHRLYASITAPGFAESKPEIVELAVQLALQKPATPEGLARQLGAVMRWSSRDRLHAITTPTLVLHGDADPLIPHANGLTIASTIPGARMMSLPGIGHLVPLEAPAETFRAIHSFLGE
jgi:pimeloyl-ACP methyl ester carboxylesterase